MKNPKENPNSVSVVRSPRSGALIVPGNPGNSGGKPGRSGRTPDAFKQRMQELVSAEDRIRHLETVLEDPTHPQFISAWKWATERAYGKAEQAVTVKAQEDRQVLFRIVRE